jgi:sugar phosphate isomerase/epimerase
MVAVSTCYWSEDLTDPEAMIADILDSGFESIELEYRISESQFQKIKSVIKKKLSVSSIHNYFPKPDDPRIKGSGDLFLLSSTDKDEHATAVKYTLKTIEYANEMEAKAVVLHLGKVDMENPFEKLKNLFEQGKITQEEGKKFVEEQIKIRNSLKQKNFDAVLKALDKLVIPAEKYGVFLGVENRFYPHEIPDLEEIKIILKEFEGSNIRYWHDIGHAVVQERLGICPQKDLIINFLDDMIGIHIHDVKGIEDHLAPGEGELNLGDILKDIKKEVIKVLEVHKKAKKENLIKAKNMF